MTSCENITQSTQPHAVGALIQQNLSECFTLAVRVLIDERLAEEAVIDAINGGDEQLLDENAARIEAVCRVAKACLTRASKLDRASAIRHPSRQDLQNNSALLICGMSALPVEGRVIVELHDRQRVPTEDIAPLVAMTTEEVRKMLHSCRIFLLEFFQLSQKNELPGSAGGS